MDENYLYIIIPVIFSLIFLSLIIWLVIAKNRQISDFKNRAKLIEIGMTKQQVIEIMGEKYSKSVEKNGNEIYEWKYRINGNGSAYHSDNFSTFSFRQGYALTIKVTFENGIVISFLSNNLD